MDLSLTIGRTSKQELLLNNPIITASGTLSNGIEFARRFDVDALGGIISKGTTLRPRKGNPQPRTVETPAGMINSIGFQNVGVSALIRDFAPTWARWNTPVIVNIMGDTVREFGLLAERLEDVPGVAALEVNVSCPNVEVGGMEFGQDCDLTADVVTEVRRSTSLPFAVKLTPNVTDIRPFAQACEKAGADALSLINTVPATAIDIDRRRPAIATIFGGLSGPAIKPIALRNVYLAASVTTLPIIASGGVGSGRDAIEFLMAGASAVQVGTSTFRDPQTPWRVLDELREWCTAEDIQHLDELVGVARRQD